MFFRRTATARKHVREHCPEVLSPPHVPNHCSQPLSPGAVPNPCPETVSTTADLPAKLRKAAAKPAKIFRLVRETKKPMDHASAQAERFLRITRDAVPDAIGCWLIVGDLKKSYRDIAEQESWPQHSWTVLGRELGKITKKKTIKSGGKRHVAYLLR